MHQAARPALHHIALTVRDVEASIPWYENLFGIKRTMDAPHEGGVGILLADPEWRLIIVLHRHDVNQGEAFSERRTGLDHVGFQVPSRAELETWCARLDELGITHSPIADTPHGSILVFRDPDNIQLEFYSPPGT
jgi:glyoxylase I family protein